MRLILAIAALLALATPAAAETRYWAYDAADRLTQSLTRGVTLEVERNLLGATRVERIISTTARGSADIRRGGPDAAWRALPEGSSERAVYTIVKEGDGRGLVTALCPGARDAWLVVGRVRPGRPVVMHAVGLWEDGRHRHCARLTYDWRGEWAVPQGGRRPADSPIGQ